MREASGQTCKGLSTLSNLKLSKLKWEDILNVGDTILWSWDSRLHKICRLTWADYSSNPPILLGSRGDGKAASCTFYQVFFLMMHCTLYLQLKKKKNSFLKFFFVAHYITEKNIYNEKSEKTQKSFSNANRAVRLGNWSFM